MTVILDTSFLFALSNRGDRNHSRVLQVLDNTNDSMVLPIVVLPEIAYLLNSRAGHYVMRQFMQELAESDMVLEPLTPADLKRVNQILEDYADSELDFADASIISIAERKNITCIFTLDRRDFSIIRPQHCDYFEILP